MENKINIAEILRDMPKGTKLYSSLLGEVKFKEVVFGNIFPIKVLPKAPDSPTVSFTENGFFYDHIEDAEALLLPSREMRDWSKLFKRGDVVVNERSGLVAIFAGWVNDKFTEFNTTINLCKKNNFWDKEKETCPTEYFSKVTDEERAKFIAAAEKHYGGKYNPETLQVEPVKVIEPKCSLKPFDKVLVRDDEEDVWKADYFSHYEEDDKIAPYVCVGSYYKLCIPYEGSEHLLGTDKSPE